MRFIVFSVILLLCFHSQAQTKSDTVKLFQNKAIHYLNTMYAEKNFDAAAALWDKTMLVEMRNFYSKKGERKLSDSALLSQLKKDVGKLYNRTSGFKIINITGGNLSVENDYLISTIVFNFSEVLDGVKKENQTMLFFISEDEGKTWAVQDWRIKDIADKVRKRKL